MTLSTSLTETFLQYKLSNAVQIKDQKNGGCHVIHKISNKVFSLGTAESTIIKYFTENATCVNDNKNIVDEKFATAVVHYLTKRDILLAKDKNLENSFNVYSQEPPILGQGCNLFELKQHDSCFIGMPYGNGNINGSGCDRAPSAVRSWMQSNGFNYKNLIKDCHLSKYLRIDKEVDFSSLQTMLKNKKLQDVGNFYIYPYEDNSKIFQRISKLSKSLATKAITPIFFGGDHSISYPILQGLNEVYDDIYLIHIDAHTDRYHSDVDQIHINSSVNHHGNFLSKSLKTLKSIKHVHQLGVRGMNNIGTTSHAKITSLGIGELLSTFGSNQSISLAIPDNANVYLSLDVDVLEPSVFPATNSPIPGGLQYHELLGVLAEILDGKKLIGADLVEFNPERDPQGISHQIFTELLLFVANFTGRISHV